MLLRAYVHLLFSLQSLSTRFGFTDFSCIPIPVGEMAAAAITVASGGVDEATGTPLRPLTAHPGSAQLPVVAAFLGSILSVRMT